jgi:glutathione S-transferase
LSVEQDYLRRVTTPADLNAVAEAESRFRWHMERIEDQLKASEGPWIVGTQFTLADGCVAPTFDRIEYLDKEHLWSGLQRVVAWYARVKSRPSSISAAGIPFATGQARRSRPASVPEICAALARWCQARFVDRAWN